MYKIELPDNGITINPLAAPSEGGYTIGVGGATISVPPNSAVTFDEELYIIDEAIGEPLPPNFYPQCDLRQSVGSTIGETTLYYGTKTDPKTKIIPMTEQYGGIVKKDKDFSYHPSGAILDWISATPTLELLRLFGRNITGKSVALSRLATDNSTRFMAMATRAGEVTFLHYDQVTNTLADHPDLQPAFDNYVSSLSITGEDKKVIEVVSYQNDSDSVIAVLLKGDIAILVDDVSGVNAFTAHQGVVKIVYGKMLTKSTKFMHDKQNLTFMPLFDDGSRDDVVNIWAIPSYNGVRYIYHYADGSYDLDGQALTVTGAPIDFHVGTDPDTKDETVYAVYQGYRLERVIGTGADTLHVANYSYQTQRYYSDGLGSPYSIDDAAALLFRLDGSVGRIAGLDSILVSYSDDATFEAAVAAYITNDDIKLPLVSKTGGLPVAETLAQTNVHSISGGETGDFELQYATGEDTKDPFTWADIRNEK